MLGIGNIGRSLKNKIWSLKTINPRKFAKGFHKSVDGTTAGGGPGMILKPEMLSKAISESYKGIKNKSDYPLLYLSPRGKRISQKQVQNFSKKKRFLQTAAAQLQTFDMHNLHPYCTFAKCIIIMPIFYVMVWKIQYLVIPISLPKNMKCFKYFEIVATTLFLFCFVTEP